MRHSAAAVVVTITVVLVVGAERGRGPTLVAVDFAEQGALLRVVDRLNS